MPWVKKGQLFDRGDVKYIALADSYTKIVRTEEDWEAAKYGYDCAAINDFVEAQPLDPRWSESVRINLHKAAQSGSLKLY